MEKIKTYDLYFTHTQKLIKMGYRIMKAEITKLLKIEYLYVLGLGNNFIEKTWKAVTIKGKNW